ncbi:MAG: type IV secretion system DNA-binding domain-containing protein [bacterium]|nr:type IV secretion system DNA-binding domain-containing protein [bacterium]
MEENKVRIIKLAPPPPELPMLGKVNPAIVSFIGRTNYVIALEEKKFVFGIKREDRRRHLYVVGKSGVGKSKLLELLMRQDIASGYGLCFVDPHGDVIEELLNFIPEERVNDVVIIDPSDTSHPVAFNPLANIDPAFKHQLTQGMIEAMEKQFSANWTPRLEHMFRFTTLALLDYPEATLRDMIAMLTDGEYRRKVIAHITDDMVKQFWEVEFEEWAEKFNTEAIIPLVNKLGQFLSDPMLRNIFGQKENKIDLERLMNEQKIILVNLAKGKLGEENSSLFGALVIAKLKQAGMARARMTEGDRKDFYLYVDEFHSIATETFESLLSEAKKYGMCITVAHQYMGQLSPKVLAAVLGNVGSLIVFRVGGADAEVMEYELAPIFKVKDMINLGRQEFYIKLMIDGEVYDPFSAETLSVLAAAHASYRDRIIAASRRNYATLISI